jgi:hypothetical protein
MYSAPWAKFTILISPIVSDKPVPKRNNTEPKEIPIKKVARKTSDDNEPPHYLSSLAQAGCEIIDTKKNTHDQPVSTIAYHVNPDWASIIFPACS